MSAPRVAAVIIVDGDVQGVGFRNYAQRRARLLGLDGYAMNLKDGRVRVLAEGSRAAIEELARHLEKGPPLSRVNGVSVRWMSPSDRFSGFDIRFAEFDS